MSWLIEQESIERIVLDGAYSLPEVIEHENADVVSSRGNATLPEFVTLYNTEVLDTSIIAHDDDESIRSGITIVQSCPSPSSSSLINQQLYTYTVIEANRNPDNVDNLQIQESEVTLSLHPNSIDSSLLTDLSKSIISSIVSEEEAKSYQGDERELDNVDSTDEQCQMSRRSSAPEQLSHTEVLRNASIINNKHTEWYSRFETEKDWEAFREKAENVLSALECPIENRDEMIAQLINMEERTFWDSSHNLDDSLALPSKLSWLLEVVALSASIALSGAVIFKILKGR